MAKNNLSDAQWYEILNSDSKDGLDLKDYQVTEALAIRNALIARQEKYAIKEQIDNKKMNEMIESKMIQSGLMSDSPTKRYLSFLKKETLISFGILLSILWIVSIPQLNVITRSDQADFRQLGFAAQLKETMIVVDSISVKTKYTKKDLQLYIGEISSLAISAGLKLTVEPLKEGVKVTVYNLSKDKIQQIPIKTELNINQNTSGNITILIKNK